MIKIERIKDFYIRKLGWVPDNLDHNIGHFNIFELDPFVGENAQPIPYAHRDFYKIMLVKGNGTVHYGDRKIEVNNCALSFSNPRIPYKWENTNQITGGYFCIFNDDFIKQFGKVNQYSVLNPHDKHIFELSEDQANKVQNTFIQMMGEMDSSYTYKYDLLRVLAFELIHYGMKLSPSPECKLTTSNASSRITSLFLELLDRQFPIDAEHQKINHRTASEFAKQLNIHVNHLNRAVKTITQKTTSQLISERILKEAKILLREDHSNISQIAYALGFNEAAHFNSFFKKYLSLTPNEYRRGLN